MVGKLRQCAVALAVLGAASVAARAQDEAPPDPAPSTERGPAFVFSSGPDDFLIDLRRGRMGINVDLRADAAHDSIGARVAGVTPGGPADRAGVQAGDLITRLNGTRLAGEGTARDDEADEEQSRPAMRLLRIASRLEPGDTVRVDVRRDAQSLTFAFVAEASDIDRFVKHRLGPTLRRFDLGPGRGAAEGGVRVFGFDGAAPTDLELVRMNAGLGDYFGTPEGMLVVEVGSDTTLGLRAGDVILSIGGRRPTSPSQALRILSTYEGDEKVEMQIMRQKRRMDITGRMRRADQTWHFEPNSLDLPDLEMQPFMNQMLRDDDRLLPMRQPLRHTERPVTPAGRERTV